MSFNSIIKFAFEKIIIVTWFEIKKKEFNIFDENCETCNIAKAERINVHVLSEYRKYKKK